MNGSKNASQLEKPFVMAGVAEAAANQDRAKRGLGEKSQSAVTGEPRGNGIAIHLADFAGAVDVHLLSDEGRQGEDLVKIANAAQEILVAEQFVEAVGTEASRPAEEKLRCAGTVGAERGAAACDQEDRVFLENRMEERGVKIQRGELLGSSRAGVVPKEFRLQIIASGRNHRFVGVVANVAHLHGANAPIVGRELRLAQAQGGLLVADSISDIELIEAVKGVADIGAAQNAIDAIVGARIGFVINVEGGLASARERLKEPVALRVERFIQLALEAVGFTKLKIGAPLRSFSPHIHSGDSAAQCERDILGLRTVDKERWLQQWRSVGLLANLNEQAIAAVLMDHSVGDAVPPANTGEPREMGVDFFGVDRLVDERAKKLLNVAGRFQIHSLDLYELRDTDGGSFAGLFPVQICGPGRIVERVRFEDPRPFGGSIVAFLEQLLRLLVIHGTEVFHLRGHDHVGPGHTAQFGLGNDKFHRAAQHFKRGLNVFRGGFGNLQVDGDYHVRAHVAHHVGRQIVD